MVFEAHCLSFPCTELLLFNYTKVNSFPLYGTFKQIHQMVSIDLYGDFDFVIIDLDGASTYVIFFPYGKTCCQGQ